MIAAEFNQAVVLEAVFTHGSARLRFCSALLDIFRAQI